MNPESSANVSIVFAGPENVGFTVKSTRKASEMTEIMNK
jgi:hypothetical protein